MDVDRRPHSLHVNAHTGFQDGEVPVYGPCQAGCGAVLRIDRLDLVAEHREVCAKVRRAPAGILRA